jgi:uncharacterized membrane protein
MSKIKNGWLITWGLLSGLILFVIAEIVAASKSSYRTMSQYIVRKAKEGHRGWRWFLLLFPPFLMLVGLWLVFHWEAPCIWFELWCDLRIRWLDI